jgi:2-polyprenyl-3-methyl-5-hydroxy-6-metoxy-1,4-benzoquinol methylase
MKNYFIKETYVSRLDNKYFDDTSNTDGWQKEVYEFAKTVAIENNFSKIMDIGTGSGYKLLKNFSEFDTLGIDLPQTVEWLRSTYPERKWSDKFEPTLGYDLIIASDVIEHIPEPDTLLNLIESCNPKLVVFSTPERDLLPPEYRNGPPKNRAHVREWTMEEFKNYIGSRFKIHQHYISHIKHATQTMLVSL